MPDFDDILGSGVDELTEINELLALISKYNLDDMVKVQILHKHFDIKDDEQMIAQNVYDQSYFETVQPMIIDQNKEVFPYLFKFK